MTQRFKQEQLRVAMASLVQNPNFVAFMEVIDELREGAVADAISIHAVESQRLTERALGEIAAYDDIRAVYRANLESVANGLHPEGE